MKYKYQSLVEKAKKGDNDSMIQLIENMNPLIYSAIRRFGRGDDREDLYQEACIIVMESVYSYDPDRGVPFLSYIKSRIYYGVFNKTRKNIYHLSIDAPLEEGSSQSLGDIIEDPRGWVEDEAIKSTEKERLKEALNCLSPKQKQTIELHYFLGMKLKDIAQKRNVHYKTVLNLKKRALKNLAAMIN